MDSRTTPHKLVVCSIALAAMALGEARAQTPPLRSVFLLRDCAAAGHTSGVDCFETLDALEGHIWGAAGVHPDAANPLTVDVGVGEFRSAHGDGSIGITCPEGGGHVTFRGVGPARSKIAAGTVTVSSVGCDALSFQDLAIVAENGGGIAVNWPGAGSSDWSDVAIEGSIPWFDSSCGGVADDPPSGRHRFFGVRIRGTDVGLVSECGDSELYASEISLRPRTAVPSFASGGFVAVWVNFRGAVRLFGSSVRLETDVMPATSESRVCGVLVGPASNAPIEGYGEFHMYSGEIEVDARAVAGMDAVALEVRDFGTGDASARTLGTAFSLGTAGGEAVRTAGDGSVRSPYLWPPGDDLPLGGIRSLDGQDLFVETDCVGGRCSGGSEPRLLIYSEACEDQPHGGGPWFDAGVVDCRRP